MAEAGLKALMRSSGADGDVFRGGIFLRDDGVQPVSVRKSKSLGQAPG